MQIQQKTFSGKLDATLKLMRLSNIAASKLLNIDPSYVSRLRNGTRIPKAGSDLVAGIAQKLGEIIWRKNLVDSMVSLMNSPSIPSQEDSFYDTFLEWFTDFHEENETDTIAVVMDAINEYALPNLSDSTALEKDLFSSLHLSKKLEYEGIRGLQEASARFLVEAYQKDAPLLRLYSDQNMSWISGNPEYYQIWKHLMFACLQRGIKIKIIHYVKREDADLLSGLLSWIPLYFAGEIESYCRFDPETPAFSHTIFLHDGHSCVEGMVVRGNEEKGRYRYGTSKADLERCNSSFDLLLKDSTHFVSSVKGLRPMDKLTESNSKKVHISQSTLPLETMSDDLFREILRGNQIAEEDMDPLMKEFFTAKNTMAKLCREKDLTLTTFRNLTTEKDRQPVDTEPFTSITSLTCTKNQWKHHLTETRESFETWGGRFHFVEENFLSRIHIFASEDIVYIKHMSLPDKTFFYNLPYMVDATNIVLHRASTN